MTSSLPPNGAVPDSGAGRASHGADHATLRVPAVAPLPGVAWPTVLLWAIAVATWSSSTVAWLRGDLPVWVMVPANAIASFAMFTVLHEASHNAAGTRHAVNQVLGRLSVPFVAIYIAFPAFRFIHMQHHRFTNEPSDRDPDAYTTDAPWWQLPARWLTVDAAYARFYAHHISRRPKRERMELAASVSLMAAVVALALVTGTFAEFVVIYLIPQRLALGLLAWWFDWLPHHGLEKTAAENRFQATRNRIGMEPILSPLMLNQNYHLVHHLHPRIPFYRYVNTWRSQEEAYLESDPALITATGRTIDADEYRRLRDRPSPSIA